MAGSAPCGARSPRPRPCCGSRPTGTNASSKRSSETSSAGSPAPTAGGPTTGSLPNDGSCAGRTSSATSPPTPKAWPPRKHLGETGLRIAEQLFAAWKLYKQDGDRRALKRRVAPLKRELRTLLETNATKRARNRYTRTISNNLLKLWPALWTFVDIDGVEPTNNHAERGLRGAVIYRKLSLGSQSDHGERTIERLLSASITCRLQKRSLHTYLTQVITAHARGDPIPALA